MSSRHQAITNKQRNFHNSKGPYIEDYDDDCFEIGHFENQEPPQHINPDYAIPSEEIDTGYAIDPPVYILAEKPHLNVYVEEEALGSYETNKKMHSESHDEEEAHSTSKLHQKAHSALYDEKEDHSASKNHQESHSKLYDEEEAHSASKRHQETHSKLYDEEEAHSASKKHQETHSELYHEEEAHSASKKHQEIHLASSVKEKSRLAKQAQSIASSKKDDATSTQQKPILRSPQKPVVFSIPLDPQSTGKKN